MYYIGVVLILVLLLVAYYLFSNKDNKLDPLNVSTWIVIVTNFPYLLFVLYDINYLPTVLIDSYTPDRVNELVLIYSSLLLLFFSFYTIGVVSVRKIKIKSVFNNLELQFSLKLNYVLLLLSLIFTYLQVMSIGGLNEIIHNFNMRAEFKVNPYFTTIIVCLISISSLDLYYQYKCKSINGYHVFLFVLIALIIFSMTGGRKNFIYLVIMLWLYDTLLSKRLSLSKNKVFSILPIFVAFYFLLVGVLRGSENGLEAVLDIANLADNLIDSLYKLVSHTSYSYTQIFIIDHFSDNAIWLGSTYTGFLSNLFSGTHFPVDEGVYIRTLAEGYYVSIPTNYNELYQSSWPPETFGNAYSNFGIAGLLFFGLLLGSFHSFVYKSLMNSIANPMIYYAYIFTLFNFHFSQLRIVQFGLFILIYFTIFLSLYFLTRIANVKTSK